MSSRRSAGWVAPLVAAALLVPPAAALAQSPSDAEGTLVVWGGSEQAVEAPLIALFNERYPNVDVEYRQLQYADMVPTYRTGLASGEGPDVFETEAGAISANFNQFAADLTPVVEEWLGPDWRDKVNDLTVEAFLDGDKLTALSAGVQGAGTIEYNKSLLDSLGLTFPTDLASWKEVCAAVEAAGKTCVAMGGADAWANQDVLHAIANQVAPGKWAQAVAGQVPWDDPDLVTSFELFRTLFTDVFPEGAAGTTTYPDAMNQFLAGDAAMIPMGAWDVANYKKDFLTAAIAGSGLSTEPFTVLHAPFPDLAGTGAEPMLFADPANSWSVNANSQNQDLAKAFVAIKTITPGGAQVWVDKLNTVPMLEGVAPSDGVAAELVDPDVQLPVAISLMEQVGATTDRRNIVDPDLVTALGDAMAQVATGALSPADAASALQATASSQ